MNDMPKASGTINHIGRTLLQNRFNAFEADKSIPYIFVKIQNPTGFEVVVIPRRHSKEKREFYESAYTENLVHVMNSEVKIVDIAMGDETVLPKII